MDLYISKVLVGILILFMVGSFTVFLINLLNTPSITKDTFINNINLNNTNMNEEDYCYDVSGQIKKPQTTLKSLPRGFSQDVTKNMHHCILNS